LIPNFYRNLQKIIFFTEILRTTPLIIYHNLTYRNEKAKPLHSNIVAIGNKKGEVKNLTFWKSK